jgi:F-type H+-transporting ATPase subunit a
VENFGAEIEHLLHFLGSNDLETGIASWHLTNYLVFLFIAVVVMLVITFVARSKASLIPQGRFYNLIELLVEFVRNDVAVANIGPEGTKYFPFLGTVFFFILINNIIGTLPGGKPGTGTMGVTVALALVAFVMFNAAGMQKKGVGGYIKGIVPHGVPGVLWPVIWVIEVISLFVRPFTLSIRLFANMYAGHIVLGIFSILTSIAVEQIIQGIQGSGVMNIAVGGIGMVAWMALLTALYLLEIGVAVLQAYIFTLLTTVYISLAVAEH